MNYELNVDYISDQHDLLYEGPANAASRLNDRLVIRNNQIKVIFQRTRIVDAATMLYTPKSNYRLYLQKTLRYHLSTTGELPPLGEITLCEGNSKYKIDNTHFTDTWVNCKCEGFFKPYHLKYIFDGTEKGNCIYIALSYWLKAQLDPFPNDQFRALWSGFNALYNYIGSIYTKERPKLEHYRKSFMAEEKFKQTIDYIIGNINRAFWYTLDWFSYANINIKLTNKGNLATFIETYPDREILDHLIPLIAAVKKGDKEIMKQIRDSRDAIEKAKSNNFIKLQFLLTNYIYNIRNSYFHGEKEYPLFIIHNKTQEHYETIICSVLKHSIVDTIRAL